MNLDDHLRGSYLSIAEAAALLGETSASIGQRIMRGELRTIVCRRGLRVAGESVIAVWRRKLAQEGGTR